MAFEVRRLRIEGIPVGPSDAQQMLLELVPDARWEVTNVIEEVDILNRGPNRITIESRVTVVRVTDEGRDITVDVLNNEKRIEVRRV